MVLLGVFLVGVVVGIPIPFIVGGLLLFRERRPWQEKYWDDEDET